MAPKSIWMVRAGQGALYVEDFLEDGLVAIGWVDAGPFSENTPKEIIEKKLASVNGPNTSSGTLGVWASQIKRYYDEIKIGDAVCTYDPSPRLYLIGTIESKVEHRDHPLSRFRKVKWTRKAARAH
jgi:restriction system protein